VFAQIDVYMISIFCYDMFLALRGIFSSTLQEASCP